MAKKPFKSGKIQMTITIEYDEGTTSTFQELKKDLDKTLDELVDAGIHSDKVDAEVKSVSSTISNAEDTELANKFKSLIQED